MLDAGRAYYERSEASEVPPKSLEGRPIICRERPGIWLLKLEVLADLPFRKRRRSCHLGGGKTNCGTVMKF